MRIPAVDYIFARKLVRTASPMTAAEAIRAMPASRGRAELPYLVEQAKLNSRRPNR
jgi:hypothetical protein